MKGLYWRRHELYVYHFIFALHLHSFAFLILLLSNLLNLVSDLAAALPLLALPIYLYLSIRRVYGQSVPWVLMKITLLSLGYLVLSIVAMLIYSFMVIMSVDV